MLLVLTWIFGWIFFQWLYSMGGSCSSVEVFLFGLLTRWNCTCIFHSSVVWNWTQSHSAVEKLANTEHAWSLYLSLEHVLTTETEMWQLLYHCSVYSSWTILCLAHNQIQVPSQRDRVHSLVKLSSYSSSSLCGRTLISPKSQGFTYCPKDCPFRSVAQPTHKPGICPTCSLRRMWTPDLLGLRQECCLLSHQYPGHQ